MNRISGRRPSPALVISLIALFAALGGTSYAVTKINGKSIAKGSIPGDRIKKNGITGTQLNESKLAVVPKAKAADTAKTAATATSATSATTATTATSATSAQTAANAANAADAAKLGGRAAADYVNTDQSKRFLVKLAEGETKELASAGGVAIDAVCEAARIQIAGRTTVANAVQAGDDSLDGGPLATDFLQPDTPLADRELADNTEDTDGVADVESDIDEGFVMAPDGTMLAVNSEGIALGMNFAGATCVVGGVIEVIRP